LWDTLSDFDFDRAFIPGKENNVADSLSRLAELMEAEGTLSVAQEPTPDKEDPEAFPVEPSDRARIAMAGIMSAVRISSPDVLPEAKSLSSSSFPLSSLSSMKDWLTSSLPSCFLDPLVAMTAVDTLAKKVLADPSAFPSFEVDGGLVLVVDDVGRRLVIPRGKIGIEADSPTFIESVLSPESHFRHSSRPHLLPSVPGALAFV
jgi:hypothetical protein